MKSIPSQKYKISLILNLSKIYFSFFLIFGIYFWTVSSVDAQNYKAKKGFLDLRKVDFKQSDVIFLDGEWQFYYGDFLSNYQLDSIQKPFFTHIPHASWSDLTWKGQQLSGFGGATYRLKVLLPPKNPTLAIFCQEQSSAYRIFLNDSFLGEVGNPNLQKSLHIANPATLFESFQATKDTLNIVVHISNFQHRKGGIWHSLEIGSEKKIRNLHFQALNLELFLYGSLLIMGIYHLFIYLLRRSDISSMYFSLMCFLVVIRLATVGERYLMIIFPLFPWDLKYRIEYASMHLFMGVVCLFVHSLFPQEFNRRLIQAVSLICLFFTLSNLFPPFWFTHLAIPFQLFALVFMLYFLGGILWAVMRKRLGAIIYLLGSLILFMTIVNDILYANNLVNTLYSMHYGFLIFFFSQAALLAQRNARAFARVEILKGQLQEINQDLEQKVQERTQALSESNKELNSALQILNEKNKEITRKNANITASLEYAKHLQESLMPSEEEWFALLPNSFIYYQAMDIVSGDFYYLTEQNDELILAVVDCTGHGVPGALMSVLGKNLLDHIIKEQKITAPNEILNAMHRGIFETFNQSQSRTHDGMNVSLIKWRKNDQEIDYAGAEFSILLHQNDEFIEVKGDRKPIGGILHGTDRAYTLKTFQCNIPTIMYLYSDGYQDQMGGEGGRKFMKKRFHQLLGDIYHLPFEQQRQQLKDTMTNWWGKKYEQIDDIMVIGINFNETKKP